MASRRQQPIVSVLTIVGASVLLLIVRDTSDLHSPYLFLLKAGALYLSVAILVASTFLAIWKRKWLASVGLILALLMNGPFLLPIFSPNEDLPPENISQLRVATFSAMTRTRNTEDILSFIKKRQPEVFCIQEVSEQDRKLLLNELNGHYRYWKQNGNNQIILSNYPLNPWADAGRYQGVVLAHPTLGDIQLVNVHMPRPYRSQNISETWQKFLTLIEGEHRAILCGDFNITPDNTLYDVLTQHIKFSDALSQGYGFTFPNSQRRSALFGPRVRIDYLFSRNLKASKTETLDISRLSDHRAIFSHFHTRDETR